jgi:hypothetical protein
MSRPSRISVIALGRHVHHVSGRPVAYSIPYCILPIVICNPVGQNQGTLTTVYSELSLGVRTVRIEY